MCPPGLGDDVQAIKAGILEIADVLVVNKADLPLASQTAGEMREMLTLRRKAPDGAWRPRVVTVSAQANGGIDELLDALEAHRDAAGVGGRRRVVAEPDGTSAATTGDPALLDTAGWRERIAALAARDGFCRRLGISVRDGGPGHAEVAMTVESHHLNFNGGCHGGAIFALADSAFGLASNSHGPVASGIDAHITFQAAVRAGDRLVARANEVTRQRRIAVYRIEVVRLDGHGGETAVSTFTGTVYIKR